MNALKVPLNGPVLAAIALNAIPILGVLLWGWSVFALLLLYWLENLTIGVRTLASMAVNAASSREVGWTGAAFFAGFFLVHYGLFCFGHGVFLIALFGQGAGGASIIDLPGAVSAAFAARPELMWGLASIVLWQFVQFALFVVRGEARRTNPMALMGAPYPRIIALHVTVLIGGALLFALGQPVWGMVVLALIKAGFDVADARKAASVGRSAAA